MYVCIGSVIYFFEGTYTEKKLTNAIMFLSIHLEILKKIITVSNINQLR